MLACIRSSSTSSLISLISSEHFRWRLATEVEAPGFWAVWTLPYRVGNLTVGNTTSNSHYHYYQVKHKGMSNHRINHIPKPEKHPEPDVAFSLGGGSKSSVASPSTLARLHCPPVRWRILRHSSPQEYSSLH